MEIPKIDPNHQSSTSTINVCLDWDLEFTPEELQSIDAIFESAASSSVRKPAADCHGDRPTTRRRLPDSLFNYRDHSALSLDNSSSKCNPLGASSSSSLVPCPRNRFSNPFRSSYRGTVNGNIPVSAIRLGNGNDETQTLKMKYPAMTFKGHIVYSRTFSEVEKAANELLKSIEAKNSDGNHAALGFDIEWRPIFKKGAGQSKTAVLQICADAARCHVMHIIHSGFPQNLKSLLGDSRFLKVGVGIAGDARKVFNDHNVSVDALEDLSRLANRKLGGEPKMWGLSSLSEKLTCKQVLKPSKIRLGNWEANPLSTEQLKYAATDAFVSWHLFEILNRLPDPETRTNEVAETVGPS